LEPRRIKSRRSGRFAGQPLYKPKEITGEKRTEAEVAHQADTGAASVLQVSLRDSLPAEDMARRKRQVADVKSVLKGIVGQKEYRRLWAGIEFPGQVIISHDRPYTTSDQVADFSRKNDLM
jgi:hypothetical protein